jgi:hypothetical protein
MGFKSILDVGLKGVSTKILLVVFNSNQLSSVLLTCCVGHRCVNKNSNRTTAPLFCGIWIATSKTHHRINSALMGGYQTAAAKVAANENSTSKKLRYLA